MRTIKKIGTSVILAVLLTQLHSMKVFVVEHMEPIHFTAVAQAEEEAREVLIEVRHDDSVEGIKDQIRRMFPENPETMIRVAKCESNFKADAFNPTNGSNDTGVFQISQKYHGAKMEKLGLDPWDVQDNLSYARLLFEANGLGDWRHSKHCWNI